MDRLPPADDADLEALQRAGWLDGDRSLIENLSELMRSGPDPSGTARRLAEVARLAPDAIAAATTDPLVGRRLVALAGASRALTATLTRVPDPVAILSAGPGRFEAPSTTGELSGAVRRALATIAAADISGEIDMPAVGRLVADVADAAVQTALALVDPGPDLAVVALGKWGGRELNYASDIDLVLVHSGDERASTETALALLDALAGAYRVDTGLRPEGGHGPLTRTLDSYRRYWGEWAEPWEAQAMLKARFVAGDDDLGARFTEAAAEFVFPERLGADAVRSIRSMKARAEGLLPLDVTELKRGIGGIRDVEFAVQLLQLVHGRADPALRTGNTLEALAELSSGGYVLADDAEALGDAYRWLRDTEHRVQLVDLRQTHTLPDQPAMRERVARSLGYRDRPEDSALEAFEADLARHRAEVRSIHERLFHRPVLDALAESRAGAMTAEAAAARLAAFGFLDTEATRTAIAELTAGLSRRSGLMRHMLPVLMEWLSLSPDPDLGLSQLQRLVEGSADAGEIVATMRDDPVAAERLCRVLGTSRLVGRLLDRLPPLVPLLGDDTRLGAWPSTEELREEATGRSHFRDDPDAAIHSFHAEHLLGIALADLAGVVDEVEVGHRVSDLADATIHAALERIAGDLPTARRLVVVALGKWGGRELGYASDLDAVVVAPADTDTEEAGRAVEQLFTVLGSGRAGLRALDLDLGLRPEGRKGSLVRTLDGFRTYWSQWAQTWELQAMLRSRAAAGDADLGRDFVAAARDAAVAPRPGREGDIRAMKARVESERIPIDEDPDFHLKLGRGGMADVEWTVQLLQMQHGSAEPSLHTAGTLPALDALEAQGLLDASEADVLRTAYRFCTRVRNRLYLRAGRPRDSLPTDPEETTRLARSLGYTATPRTALREDYRRLTRRARRVVEQRFYGIDRPGEGRNA